MTVAAATAPPPPSDTPAPDTKSDVTPPEKRKAKSETVIIGCKSPSGLVLEIGLQTFVPDSATGRPITAVKRLPSYQRIVIKGWNAHQSEMRVQLLKAGSASDLPHGMNTAPFLNRNVPRAFWEQWKKEHSGSWLLKNGVLFEATDEASAQLQVLESKDTPTVFEPLDRTKVIVPGVGIRTDE